MIHFLIFCYSLLPGTLFGLDNTIGSAVSFIVPVVVGVLTDDQVSGAKSVAVKPFNKCVSGAASSVTIDILHLPRFMRLYYYYYYVNCSLMLHDRHGNSRCIYFIDVNNFTTIMLKDALLSVCTIQCYMYFFNLEVL